MRSPIVLILDRDRARARDLAQRVERTGGIARVAAHLADALVQSAISRPDIAIVALGTWPGTRAALSALRSSAPDLEILLTGSAAGDATVPSVLDAGELYMPAISDACLAALLSQWTNTISASTVVRSAS